MRLCVQIAMVNGKFSTPQLSLEYMERGLRTAIAIAEPVEQSVVVMAATNEVLTLHTDQSLRFLECFSLGCWKFSVVVTLWTPST